MAKRKPVKAAKKRTSKAKPSVKRTASSAGPAPLPPDAVMMQMIGGHWIARTVHALAQLGVADKMKGGPKSAAELAEATGTHAGSLDRLMRAATMFGVFTVAGGGKYALTPVGDTLRSDTANSLRNFAMFYAEPWYWNVWSEFPHSVKTGQPAFPKFHGAPVFEWLGKNPQASETFNRAMTSFTRQIGTAVAEAFDFSPFHTLVDVGGGHGTLLEAILRRNPSMRGIVFDLPAVVEGARAPLGQAGLGNRTECVGGSFFESAPQGDAHILKHIIHDWSDEQGVTILRHCRAAMPRDGRVLLVEVVIPEGPEPHFGKLLDLEMLAMTQGGRERTAGEFRELLGKAGFKLARIVPTRSPVSVIEGMPA
ncbi:MAG: O-methyltransferase family [Planctomycetota bacterium]|nr:MAG: O-methyltransferase family [Planctomycetota bacterium]